jgi:hypothetical protein
MVRNMFEPDPSFINLENGYFSPQPVSTRNFFGQRTAYINRHTSRYMRTEQDEGREKVRTALAKMAGSGVDETAIVRNTTEAMNVIIMGYPWKAGDEAIYSDQDYGSMVEQLQQAPAPYASHQPQRTNSTLKSDHRSGASTKNRSFSGCCAQFCPCIL